MKNELPNHTIVEVVMKKEVSYEEYQKMISSARKKGWQIQAYQTGVFSTGYKKEI